jgi:hypothetical protein
LYVSVVSTIDSILIIQSFLKFLVKFNKIIVFYLLFNKKGYIAFLCALYYIMSRRFETLYPSAKPAWWKSGLIPPTMFADPPMADPPPSMIEAVAPLIQLVDIAVEPIEPYPAKVSKPYFEPWNYETLYRFWDAGDNTVRDNPKITHKNQKPHPKGWGMLRAALRTALPVFVNSEIV